MKYDSELYDDMKKRDFLEKPAMAVDAVNYTDIEIIDIIHGIDEKIVIREGGKVHILKIYSNYDNDYFVLYGNRWSLSDFIKIDSPWMR